MKNLARRPVFGGTDSLHALAEQNIAQGSEQDHEENENISLQVQHRGIFHTLLASAFALRSIARGPLSAPRIHQSLENYLTGYLAGTKQVAEKVLKFFEICRN